jgi:hypothetical protein
MKSGANDAADGGGQRALGSDEARGGGEGFAGLRWDPQKSANPPNAGRRPNNLDNTV